MANLDYRAGSNALNNVTQASRDLMEANRARSAGVANSFLQMQQILQNYGHYKENAELRELEKQKLKSDIKARDTSTAGQEVANRLAGKELEYFDKNQKLKADSVKSQIAGEKARSAQAYAVAGETNQRTKEAKKFQNFLDSNFANQENLNPAMLDFYKLRQ